MTKLWSKMRGTERFELVWREHGLGTEGLEREYRFHQTRRWRFDYAWPSFMLAVEIHGFGWGHQTMKQMSSNREKVREAIKLGWRVMEYTSRCLGSRQKVEDAVEEVKELLMRLANRKVMQ